MKNIIKKIGHFLFDEFILPIKNDWAIRNRRRKLNRAKKYADFMSETHNGSKYVVMKNPYGNFAIFAKKEFLIRKRRGQFVKEAQWGDIVRDALYVAQKKEK